jgi:hypothetical protein
MLFSHFALFGVLAASTGMDSLLVAGDGVHELQIEPVNFQIVAPIEKRANC